MTLMERAPSILLSWIDALEQDARVGHEDRRLLDDVRVDLGGAAPSSLAAFEADLRAKLETYNGVRRRIGEAECTYDDLLRQTAGAVEACGGAITPSGS